MSRWESNQVPKLRTEEAGDTSAWPILILSMDTFDNCRSVPMIKNSVLSSFSINLSSLIHARTSRIQFSIAITASASLVLSTGLNDIYSCVIWCYFKRFSTLKNSNIIFELTFLNEHWINQNTFLYSLFTDRRFWACLIDNSKAYHQKWEEAQGTSCFQSCVLQALNHTFPMDRLHSNYSHFVVKMWSLCILELLLIFHQLSWLQILALTSLSNQIFILLILIPPVSQGPRLFNLTHF